MGPSVKFLPGGPVPIYRELFYRKGQNVALALKK